MDGIENTIAEALEGFPISSNAHFEFVEVTLECLIAYGCYVIKNKTTSKYSTFLAYTDHIKGSTVYFVITLSIVINHIGGNITMDDDNTYIGILFLNFDRLWLVHTKAANGNGSTGIVIISSGNCVISEDLFITEKVAEVHTANNKNTMEIAMHIKYIVSMKHMYFIVIVWTSVTFFMMVWFLYVQITIRILNFLHVAIMIII